MAKQNYFMIAIINDAGGNRIGIRMLDVSDFRSVRVMDVKIESAIRAVESGAAIIQNLAIEDGKLVGTNGSMDRYAVVEDGRLKGKSPMIVINRVGDIGFTVSDYIGTVRKFRAADVIEYAKKEDGGIANGKLVVREDGAEIISSIVGSYEEAKKARKMDFGLSDKILLEGKSNLANRAGREADNEVAQVDVFECMSKDQRNMLRQYYMWHTVQVYRKLAKTIRLDLAPGKAEQLAALRGEEEWVFAGVVDCGHTGGSCCELGHPIRYEYYAMPVYSRDMHDAIIFGETCSADFFDISQEEMRKLIKVRMIMSGEIELMSYIISNNLQEEYWGRVKFLKDLVEFIGDLELIRVVFGTQVGSILYGFWKADLPFPMSVVDVAIDSINSMAEGSSYGHLEIWHRMALILQNSAIEQSVEAIAKSRSRLAEITRTMNGYVVKNRIAGFYAYDPHDDPDTRRLKGRNSREYEYNQDSRNKRRLLTGNIKHELVNDINYEDFGSILVTLLSLGRIIKMTDLAGERIEQSELNSAFTFPGVWRTEERRKLGVKAILENDSFQDKGVDRKGLAGAIYQIWDGESKAGKRLYMPKIEEKDGVISIQGYYGYGGAAQEITEVGAAIGHYGIEALVEQVKKTVSSINGLEYEAPKVSMSPAQIMEKAMAGQEEFVDTLDEDLFDNDEYSAIGYEDSEGEEEDGEDFGEGAEYDEEDEYTVDETAYVDERPQEKPEDKPEEPEDKPEIRPSVALKEPEKSLDEIIEELESMMKNHPELDNEQGTVIVKGILTQRGQDTKFTSKQIWRIKERHKRYCNPEDKEVENTESKDSGKADGIAEDLSIKINDIIGESKADKNRVSEILRSICGTDVAVRIAYTVRKTGKASSKQEKFISEAHEALMNHRA